MNEKALLGFMNSFANEGFTMLVVSFSLFFSCPHHY